MKEKIIKELEERKAKLEKEKEELKKELDAEKENYKIHRLFIKLGELYGRIDEINNIILLLLMNY